MASQIYLLVSLLSAIGCVQGLFPLPDYIPVCKSTEPNMVECLSKSVAAIRPHLVNGIPEMDIPKLEPLIIESLVLSEKSPTSGGITMAAHDVETLGASNFEVTSIKMEGFAKKYVFELKFPRLNVKGKYLFDGLILLLPLKGNGDFTGNFTDSSSVNTVILEEYEKGGEMHVKVKKITIRIKVGKGRIRFGNLFNGNKDLSDVLNNAINDNFQMYMKEVIPSIEKAFVTYSKTLASKIMDRFTVDQLFPK